MDEITINAVQVVFFDLVTQSMFTYVYYFN